jgi:DNA polymerase I-like protein with 3'-5' exonuclease and polymerase domains
MKYCEVVVLQWLSQDEKLKEIMASGVDLHQEIYQLVTGDVCDSSEKREISKRLFLPVVYGCGAKRLSENLGLPIETSKEIIDRIHRLFPTAMAWIVNKQVMAKTQTVQDYFGRPRNFGENESYLARNFVVQSVAATVCLEKLVDVYRAISKKNCRICFTIHDGYGLVCSKSDALSVIKIVKPILESESKLCPGLELKSTVKFGKKLDQLKSFTK